MQDFFPTMMLKPNYACDDYHCRLRQKEHKEFLILNPVKEIVKQEEVTVVHEENDWGKFDLIFNCWIFIKTKLPSMTLRYFFGGWVWTCWY